MNEDVFPLENWCFFFSDRHVLVNPWGVSPPELKGVLLSLKKTGVYSYS